MKINKSHCVLGLLITGVLVSLTAKADKTNIYVIDFGKNISYSVKATNGFELGFFSYSQPPYTINQPIELAFKSSKKFVAYVPKNDYVGIFTLYDADNRPVTKTALGESFKLNTNLKWSENVVRQSGNGQPFPWTVHSDDCSGNRWVLYKGWSILVDFPKIDKLFKIEKPGKYRLELEIQVFLSKGGNESLMRFPPLEIPVSVKITDDYGHTSSGGKMGKMDIAPN